MLTRHAAAALAAAVSLLAACGPEVVQAGPTATAGGALVDVTPPTTSDTTTVPAGRGLFEEGQCLTWDQSSGDAAFDVVPCAEPHLVEVTAAIDLAAAYADGEPVPSAAELAELAATRCAPVAAAYLGRDLDGEAAGIILPSTAAWDGGERGAWCTVGLERVGGERPSYTGTLRDR